MQLSDRLMTVISMVPQGSIPADIGTDHGFVPIRLVESGVCERALAMDINPGPLARAKEHIERAGLSDRIRTILSNGTEKLPDGEADTILISGMGGDLMAEILRSGMNRIRNCTLILSPQGEPWKVRRLLEEEHFRVDCEKMLEEDGKYYIVLRAVPGADEPYTEEEFRFGRLLLRNRDKCLKTYLDGKKARDEQVLAGLQRADSESAAAARARIEAELGQIRRALEVYGYEMQ